MSFNRFKQVSPFKNVEAHVAKKEHWFSELPTASTSHLDSSDGIKASDSFAIARGLAQGTLIFLPFGHPGKQGQKAATWQASGRPITDFDTSYVEPLLATASDDGRINIASLPSEDSLEPGVSASLSLSQCSTFQAPAQKAVEIVKFHPTTAGLLLTNQASDIQVWDIGNGGESKAVYNVKGAEKGHWSVSWSHEGRLVQTAGKDNILSLWDIRQSTDKAVATTTGHQGFNKASRIISVDNLVFTTGFSKMRDRECALWDPRNFDKPLKKQIIDTNTGVLMPLADHARKMVYLVGRSDMTLRWAEVVDDTSLTIGSAPLPMTSQGAALVPSTSRTLDVMQAEVQKLVVLSHDAVAPVTMRVPRRSYLDFYDELFPPIRDYRHPAQEAQVWLSGKDAPPALISPQPGKTWGGGAAQQEGRKPEEAAPSAINCAKVTVAPTAGTLGTPAPPPAAPPATKSANGQESEPIIDTAIESLNLGERESTDSKHAQATASSESTEAASDPVKPVSREHSGVAEAPDMSTSKETGMLASPTPPQSPTAAPKPQSVSQSHWSRSFLAGKTHLKPEFEDVRNISNTTSASVQLLKANMKYFFYPLAGPGGRLAYHPVEQKGRLPVQIPCVTSGHDIVDFVLSPFDEEKLFIAGGDGKIRVFRLKGGSAEQDPPQASTVLDDSMDRLVELAHHPNLANVLLSASEDHGQHNIRVWDCGSGTVLSRMSVPGKGLHSVAWDHLGSRVAVACKDKKLRILDPRSSSLENIAIGSSHESMRPVKVVWVNSTHLITCGFSRSASREILLYRISNDGETIEQVAKATIDVSPAPLFPYYDEDTRILFAYSKGERTCHAFELTNISEEASSNREKATLTKLPRFEHGTLQLSFAFLPKQKANVKEVVIAHAYRMTSNSVMYVKFSIPRAKMDYFQDDIYNGGVTRETMKPDTSLTIEEWISGKDTKGRFVDIRPEGMPLLSHAPPPPPRAKQQVLAKQLSEEESHKTYLDNLFKHKQAEVDSDEDDQRLKERDAMDDDDW